MHFLRKDPKHPNITAINSGNSCQQPVPQLILQFVLYALSLHMYPFPSPVYFLPSRHKRTNVSTLHSGLWVHIHLFQPQLPQFFTPCPCLLQVFLGRFKFLISLLDSFKCCILLFFPATLLHWNDKALFIQYNNRYVKILQTGPALKAVKLKCEHFW